MKTIFTLIMITLGIYASAQEISGRIIDDKNETLANAAVQILQVGTAKGGTATDLDGSYSVKPLDPGYYDMLICYSRLDTIMETGVPVSPNQRTTVNVQMSHKLKDRTVLTKMAYKKSLVDDDKLQTGIKVTCGPENAPTEQISDLVALNPVLYQSCRQDINIEGAKTDGTTYVIDGVAIQQPKIDTIADPGVVPLPIQYTSPDNPDDYIITRKGINHMPYSDTRDIIATLPGTYQARRGDELHIYGSR